MQEIAQFPGNIGPHILPGNNFNNMGQKRFEAKNYITVPGFAIVDLGLSGNELLCYSLIYGFTQDSETEFRGSLAYISSALNVTRQNALRIIARLIDKGLVSKREVIEDGVRGCRYITRNKGVAKTATGCCRNSNRGVIETATGGVAERATINNNSIDISNNNTNIGDNAHECAPSLFPAEIKTVKKEKGTAEPLCLFADSRFFDAVAFGEQFKDEGLAGVDIEYYYHAVADWSAGGGKKKRDWIATARNFMRSDKREGKLQMRDAGLSESALRYLLDMQKLRG